MRVILDVAESRGIKAIRLPAERILLGDLFVRPLALVRSGVLTALCQWSRSFIRRSTLTASDAFTGVARTGSVTPEWLLQILRSLRPGVTEIMVHPGYCDSSLLEAPTRLTSTRPIELQAVTDPRVVEFVRTSGIGLTHFGVLADR